MATWRRCCVPGCIHTGDSLHRFPNPNIDRTRFNTWLYAIGGDVINLETAVIFKYRRVCRRHFEEKYHCRNSRLSNIAIPTLQMPDWRSPQYFAGSKTIQAVKNIESKTSKLIDNKTSQDDKKETHVPFEFHDVQEKSDPVETEESPQHNLEETISETIKIDESSENNLEQTIPADETEKSPEFHPKLNTEQRPYSLLNIHHSLPPHWNPILKKGLSKDVKDKIMTEYLIPHNCQLLKAPTLNPEIQAAVSEEVVNCDRNYQFKQNQLGVGISAINQAISLLLCGEDKMQAVKMLYDSCRILTDLHYMETQARKEMITPYLDERFRLGNHDRDEMLFGKELSETIKASNGTEEQIRSHFKNKDMNQRASSLTRVYKARISSSGNGPVSTRSLGNGTIPSCLLESRIGQPAAVHIGLRTLPTQCKNQGSNQVANQDVNDAES